MSAFQTLESTEAVVEGVKALLGGILSEEQVAQFTVENVTNALSHGLTESFLNAALSLRDEVKRIRGQFVSPKMGLMRFCG